jgi:RND family efflux transporter MFP subunit
MSRLSHYLLSLAAVCAVATMSSSCRSAGPAPVKQDAGPVKVDVSAVRTRSVQRVVETVGTLFPFDEAIISAEVEGRVESVNADLGDQVTAGQVLMRISDEEQRYMVAQMDAQLRQGLERLGLKDEKDKLQDLTQAPDVRRARADLYDAETRFKRRQELFVQGIGPRSDVDQVTARLQSPQAGYDAILYQTRNLIQEVERFKAQCDLQRKKLRDTTVKAPYAAWVKVRQVTPGGYVRANSPLFTLVKIDPIRLRIEVPEKMAPWVKVGQVAEVTVEAFQGRLFQGKVWRIAPTVDQTKRTFIVEALIQNPKNELKPGSYARAKLPTDHLEQVRVMSDKALNYVLGSNKAYVVKGDTVDARDVKVGDRFPGEVEVLEGVENGESVAVTSLGRLDTGVKVRATLKD